MNIELLLRKSCTFWNPSVPKINKTCTVTDSLWFNFFWQLDSTDVLLCWNGQQAMPQNLSQGLTAVDTPAEPAACQIQMSEKSTCWKRRSVNRFPLPRITLAYSPSTEPTLGVAPVRDHVVAEAFVCRKLEALKHSKCIFQPTYIAAIRY